MYIPTWRAFKDRHPLFYIWIYSICSNINFPFITCRTLPILEHVGAFLNRHKGRFGIVNAAITAYRHLKTQTFWVTITNFSYIHKCTHLCKTAIRAWVGAWYSRIGGHTPTDLQLSRFPYNFFMPHLYSQEDECNNVTRCGYGQKK